MIIEAKISVKRTDVNLLYKAVGCIIDDFVYDDLRLDRINRSFLITFRQFRSTSTIIQNGEKLQLYQVKPYASKEVRDYIKSIKWKEVKK